MAALCAIWIIGSITLGYKTCMNIFRLEFWKVPKSYVCDFFFLFLSKPRRVESYANRSRTACVVLLTEQWISYKEYSVEYCRNVIYNIEKTNRESHTFDNELERSYLVEIKRNQKYWKLLCIEDYK